ncbi:MAG: DUF177 domain-containing protein [Bacteroidota bacterium]
MNYPEQYKIAFGGLKPGTFIFDFQIGAEFFEQFENTDISNGTITVKVTMVKEERMMDLHFALNGSLVVPCDRCNEPVELAVNGDERLIVKPGDHYFEESEDVQIIPETDYHFDIAPFLYEYIQLMLPIRRIHPEDDNGNSQCNPEIIKMLTELHSEKEPDPRWDALNKLKEKFQS